MQTRASVCRLGHQVCPTPTNSASHRSQEKGGHLTGERPRPGRGPRCGGHREVLEGRRSRHRPLERSYHATAAWPQDQGTQGTREAEERLGRGGRQPQRGGTGAQARGAQGPLQSEKPGCACSLGPQAAAPQVWPAGAPDSQPCLLLHLSLAPQARREETARVRLVSLVILQICSENQDQEARRVPRDVLSSCQSPENH